MNRLERAQMIQLLEDLCGIPQTILVRLSDSELRTLYEERIAPRQIQIENDKRTYYLYS